MTKPTVYIIGSGIIGAACGVNLSLRGYAVNFIDHREPGTAASFGNAGCFVSWDVLPENSPEVFRKALRWMFQKDGFVKMQPSYLPQMLEWFYHYQKSARSRNLKVGTDSLSQLVEYSQAKLWPIVQDTNAADLVQRTGGLSIYDTEHDLLAEIASLAARNLNSEKYSYEVLTQDDLQQIEPDIPRRQLFGLLRPDDGTLRNPPELVRRWFDICLQRGGGHILGEVSGFDLAENQITGIRLKGGDVRPIKDAAVVVAAGAWSNRLAAQLGYRVPLRASRGYHLTFPNPEMAFRRTVLFEDHGYMMTHMQQGLRFAGTVEYDDPDKPINPKRVENLRKRVFRMFPDLAEKEHSTWFGSRPSLPDSLPVISGSNEVTNAFFAFGHGSLGVTNATATGALIADMVMRRQPEIGITPYRIDRFSIL